MSADSLTITCGTDGTWLNFRASNGQSTSLRIEGLADERRGIIGQCLRQWAYDRQTEYAEAQRKMED